MLPQAPVCDAGGMPSPQPRPAIPRAIWVLGFVSMLMDISSEMVHSLLPVFMVTALGASAFTVGLIDGAGEATALLVKLVSGTWSDRMGRRKPLAVAGYALGALSKPLFALAGSTGMVLGARLMDRVGKGLRGAPRDALVADIAPPAVRGAAFGLRQSLDTVGAFLGPLLAMGLMLLWHNDFQAIFWVAIVPGLMAVALLALGVREPARAQAAAPPSRAESPATSSTASSTTSGSLGIPALPAACWWVVALGGVFTLARVSEAFLVLRAQHAGLGLAWTPLVLIAMNLVYALAAYPMGRLADRVAPPRLLALGMGVLVMADLVLAWAPHMGALGAGVLLFGLHMAMTQGVLAAMVAASAPPSLRGTAFGWFNLVSGVAMLVSGAAAGLLWDRWGPASTFLSSALLALGALALLAWIGRARAAQPDAAT